MCLWWTCSRLDHKYSLLNRAIFIGIFLQTFFLIFGARFIQLIEIDNDLRARSKFHHELEQFMIRNNVDQSEIDKLFLNIREAALNGIWMDRNLTSDPNWTFGQAFFFAGTLISTVGYGRVSPRTEYGKLFTILYCVIGIPLTLALLSAIVARMREPSHKLRGLLNQRLGHLFTVNHIQLIHVGVVFASLLLFVFAIPAWVFSSIETDWSYLDAFYYCFVSLTTIGLGDFEPGDDPNQSFRGLYKIGATVYLMGGLCCMMLFLATLYDIPQFNLTSFFVKSDEEMRFSEEDGKYGTLDSNVVENGFYSADH
ncbi:Two pore potassium channel protein sup-9 [Caenorhabditis elegans]|uniref:Two pore potassium channel protein sup-9 n=1 Tax=Caenorhabditis elegans TaxID=6239 RepID=B2FDA9_CAEEL|nr:Two pore potassium channel protein sup-9 [Caenorhabditis elegans]CAQ48405.1 Two pore potassium channel protein sup-9 [Caenorhabditis elegans]|eukprot:NP_001129916.1 Two pore potassium channel protein sup-9 [Caenorhabditis elegans]